MVLVMVVALALGVVPAGAGTTCAGLAVTIPGTPGPDTLEGTEGDDVILGFDGDDVIRGNGGNDTICGGAGADGLAGGGGQDVLIGGVGDDSFAGGPGADTIRGGSGHDTVSYQEASGGVQLNLEKGTVGGAGGRDVIAGVESVIGSRFDDLLVGTRGSNVLDGSEGRDQLFGDDGNDELNGGLGNDWLRGGLGRDTLDGGDGVDEASYLVDYTRKGIKLRTTADPSRRAPPEFIVTGGHGRDELVSIEAMEGSPFDDDLDAEEPLVKVAGGPGDDVITARKAIGGRGDDTLEGRELKGGPGDDQLFWAATKMADGGSGRDALTFQTISQYATGFWVHVDLGQGTFAFPDSDSGFEGKVKRIEHVVGTRDTTTSSVAVRAAKPCSAGRATTFSGVDPGTTTSLVALVRTLSPTSGPRVPSTST